MPITMDHVLKLSQYSINPSRWGVMDIKRVNNLMAEKLNNSRNNIDMVGCLVVLG